MKKIMLIILCLGLAALLLGAGVLYKNLSEQVQIGGLVTQPPTETIPAETAEATEEAMGEATEEVSYAAPDFTMLDWEGNERKLSEFVGKPVILNFWASWCGPCKSEMPDLEAAFEKYGEDIHFIMLNVTGGRETVESAKAFIEEAGYSFPVYFDSNGEASYRYGASSIPMTFFIDANGDLVTYGMGALSAEILEKGIGYIYTEE